MNISTAACFIIMFMDHFCLLPTVVSGDVILYQWLREVIELKRNYRLFIYILNFNLYVGLWILHLLRKSSCGIYVDIKRSSTVVSTENGRKKKSQKQLLYAKMRFC